MDKNNIVARVKELTNQLHKASIAYYKYDNQIMTDKQYDELYDELEKLENESGIVLSDSPTHYVQGYVLDELKKVKHTKPMLSAKKTKNPNEIKSFLKDYDWYCSYKMDGLTLVVRYNENGEFIQGITRGTDGIIGEDVTEQCRFIKNLPMKIPCSHPLELRGECVISYDEFNRINKEVLEPFKHPRGLAGGTLRTLDLSIVRDRNLAFIVFELVSPTLTHKLEGLDALDKMGFETVQRCKPKNKETGVEDCIEAMQPEFCKYPIDGLIFELNNTELSKSLGATSHHENCRMALKLEDETYPTTLKYVDWTMGKFGTLTPTAGFEPVEIDGSIVERASLHNISVMKDLGIKTSGQTVYVYKSNMIIPQIDSVEPIDKEEKLIPDKCPICGQPTKIVKDNNSEVLVCTNDNCNGKLLGKLTHAASKNALNIENLSESTIDKFINLGWLNSIKDIYHLSDHENEMKSIEGFGKKSVEKLLSSINKSRNTSLERFVYSLSIPLIGKSASKDISKLCEDNFDNLIGLMKSSPEKLLTIDGFGVVTMNSMAKWWYENSLWVYELSKEFTFEKSKSVSNETSNILDGKTFVVTGSVNHYKNRDELKADIVAYGGTVVGSVSSKTSYLINNDINSTSSKNQKAKSLGIPIISEDQFLAMIH
jgi:DNA ligase (NAD+)|uniref:DNA ligase (NAD(+)) n=1 Tax=Siphoviridae sp. ctCIv11 TaxID=2827806 RepID=A0A8S5S2C9_9CAUD|nr:MAG TPA: DNA ligase [Siphoviridae sp. ctCIv11]